MPILYRVASRPARLALCLALAATALVAVAAAPAAAATSAPAGTYVATSPTRVLDTRTGAYGNRKGAVRAGSAVVVRVTGSSGVPSNAAAVAVTISVVSAARAGSITASKAGLSTRPHVTSVVFGAGRQATDLAAVPVASGRIKLWNVSPGRVQLVADVTGYYVGGTPTVDGALHLRGPRRVVDTRSGLNGFHHGALRAGTTLSADLARLAGLPADAGAVAATVTVYSPTRSGSLVAYATRTTRPSSPLLDFTRGRAVSQYGVLPTSDIQGLSVYNASAGSVQVTIDIVGYLTSGPAAVAHGQQVAAANRAFVDGTLPAHSADAVPVLGRGGVPRSGVAAVAVSVRVSKPARSGALVGSGHHVPIVASFGAGVRATGEALLRVVNGKITLHNTSSGSVALEVDVVGYVPSTSLTVPAAVSVARYPNDLTADVTSDAAQMNGYGQDDAGATWVLLDLGAQSIHAPLSAAAPGITLALTDNVRIGYGDLVTILESYIDGLAFGGRHVTLAVGTNNDGDWSTYHAAARGADFANDVIDPLAAYGAGKNVTVLGANDIEASFGTTRAIDAINWENAYFANTSADLVFNGALINCPTVFGSTAPCAYGWTQDQYVTLTRHVEGGRNRTQVLPQIYFAVQAVQWANIYARAGAGLRFAGSLTEHGADSSTYLPAQGWAALVRALQWRKASPGVPRAVDIAPDV